MFSLSVVCTLNTQLKLLPFKRYTVLRRTVNGNFILSPTVVISTLIPKTEALLLICKSQSKNLVPIAICFAEVK